MTVNPSSQRPLGCWQQPIRCEKCGLSKPPDEFPVVDVETRRRGTVCKSCQA